MRWWNCNFFPNNALLKSRYWFQYPKLEEIVCNIKTFTLTPKFSVPLNVRMQFSCTWKASPHSSICTHSTNLSSTTTSYNKHFLGSKLETVCANSERDVKWAFWLYFPSYVYPSGKKGFFFSLLAIDSTVLFSIPSSYNLVSSFDESVWDKNTKLLRDNASD